VFLTVEGVADETTGLAGQGEAARAHSVRRRRRDAGSERNLQIVAVEGIDVNHPTEGLRNEMASCALACGGVGNKQSVVDALNRSVADFASFLSGGGLSIQNADSEKELNEKLMGSPLGLFYQFNVLALENQSRLVDILAETFEEQRVLSNRATKLEDTWHQSVSDFDAAFRTPNPYAANQFGNEYYDPNITVITPSNKKLYPRDVVLADFIQTCPQFHPKNITTMDQNSGMVIGNGTFWDNDHPGTRTIHFEFTWIQNGSGDWVVKNVWST